MERLRKSRWSSLKPDRVCSKNESAKSKVRGFLDDLPPVEEVFPFLNFQPEFAHFTTHGSLHPSELDISTFLAQDSLEIPKDLFSFPTNSHGDWVWLGEDGYDHDAPPLEPIFSAPPSNPIDFDQFTAHEPFYLSSDALVDRKVDKRDYYNKKVNFSATPSNPIYIDQFIVHEPSYFNRYACPDEEIEKRDCFKKKVKFAAPPSNPIDIDQFTVHEPSYFSSNALVDREVEKRDYYKKKVRFSDSKHTKRKTKPDKHSIYETPRKKANVFRESVLEMSSLVSTQSNPSKHPSKVRHNFAPKCDRSIGSETTMPLKEPSKSASIEVRFNNVADILTIASQMSNGEFESIANGNDKVTSRSTSRSGKVEQVFPMQEVKHLREGLSTYNTDSPIASCDIQIRDGMMENPVITPYKNVNIIDSDSDATEIYFSASHPGSSNEGDDSSGKLSKGEPRVVVEMEEAPRRSTRIHLRQCRGKQNNLTEPLWTENEWWTI